MRCGILFLVVLVCSVGTGYAQTTMPSSAPSAYLPVIGVPSLDVKASWPEQKIAANTIHKMRVPRGGTIDITATIDPAGATLPASTVTVDAGGLVPVELVVDGKEVTPTGASVIVNLPQKRQVCWTFQIPWETRAAQKEYRFDVAVVQPPVRYSRASRNATTSPTTNIARSIISAGAAPSVATKPAGVNETPFPPNGTLKASVAVEVGMSCYDTTLKNRLDEMAKSPYCKIETIGKTVLGRDMYMLRITDWTVPAKDKKQFIIIGPHHGNEPAGVESSMDFVWELLFKPENKEYLKHFTIYMIPSHNPDGHELSLHQNVRSGIDLGNYGYVKLEEPESFNVHKVLTKYAPEFTDAMALVQHQWGRDFTLLSHMDNKPIPESASCQLMQNVAIRVTNDTGRPMQPSFTIDDGSKPYTGVRGFLMQKLGIPNFTLEDSIGSGLSLADQMPFIVNQVVIAHATLAQMANPQPVKPKPRPTSDVKLPSERMLKIYRTDTPPTIDGKGDDACWAKAAGSITLPVAGGTDKTTILVCYDDKNLYIAFKAADWVKSPTTAPASGPAGSVTTALAKVSLWNHDGCELMLDTNFNRWSYYHLAADTAGEFALNYYMSPGLVDLKGWKSSDIKIVASVDGGSIEFCIPFAALNHALELDGQPACPPSDGAIWGAN
ncbi:MAG: hypothetical protein EHM48_06080, partial [Planctomycetaceae bacterium]